MVPYDLCKMTGVELLYNISGTTNMKVKVPDGEGGYVVEEQYGYSVNIGDVYSREAGYAATLFAGLELEVMVTNTTAEESTMGVNFILHEVRPL